MIESRICACGCGGSLTGLRADALYQSEACKKRAQRAASRDKAGTESLDEVRAKHEESKGRWTVIVREHLNRTLFVTGYVSAEDFDALGIPPEHSNLANAQMGSYSKQGFMEAISWHRSKKPSRKSGKVWVHKLTEKGREHLSPLVGSDREASLVGASQLAVASNQSQDSSPVGQSSGPPGGDGIPAALSGGSESVGPAATAGGVGRSPRSGRSGEPGGPSPTTVGAGTHPSDNSTKSGAVHSPPTAATGIDRSPDSLVQLEGARKAPSMYDPMEGEAA